MHNHDFNRPVLANAGRTVLISSQWEKKPLSSRISCVNTNSEAMVLRNTHSAQEAKRGRPPNLHIPYRDEAKKPSRCRIVRSSEHEHLARFVGKWFSRCDDLLKSVSEISMTVVTAHVLAGKHG
ncbi:hypothetical protein JOM56_006430 [Amanita muscaria]